MSNPLFSSLGLARPAVESEQIIAEAGENAQNTLPDAVKTLSDEQITDIAKQAHETNRGYCEKLGDGSQLSWDDTTDKIRQSAIDGVKNIIADPTVTPKGSHDNWMKFKQADGWTYGEVKDEAKKEHPCMVPYDELPEEEKVKDQLFTDTVKALLSQLQHKTTTIQEVPMDDIHEDVAALERLVGDVTTLNRVGVALESAPAGQFNPVNAALATAVTESITSFKSTGLMLSTEAYSEQHRALAVEYSVAAVGKAVQEGFNKVLEFIRRIITRLYEAIVQTRNKVRKERAVLIVVKKMLDKHANNPNKDRTQAIEASAFLMGMTSPAQVRNNVFYVTDTPAMFSEAFARTQEILRFISSFTEQTYDGTVSFDTDKRIDSIADGMAHLKGKFHNGSYKDQEGLMMNPKALAWIEAGVVLHPKIEFVETGVQQTGQNNYEIQTLTHAQAKDLVTQLSNRMQAVETTLTTADRCLSLLKRLETRMQAKADKLRRNSPYRGAGEYDDELIGQRGEDVAHLTSNARKAARLAALSVGAVGFLRRLESSVVMASISLVKRSTDTWGSKTEKQPVAA